MKFIWISLGLSMLICCKTDTEELNSHLQSETSQPAGFVAADVWVPKTLTGPKAELIKLLMGQRQSLLGSEVSAAYQHRDPQSGRFFDISGPFQKPFDRLTRTPIDADATGTNFHTVRLWQGVALGNWIYVLYTEFSLSNEVFHAASGLSGLLQHAQNQHWRIATRASRTLRENGVLPDASGRFDIQAPLIDKVMDIVWTKYVGPDTINQVLGGIDQINQTARFIPAYAGVHDFFHGDNSWQQGVGVILVASDLIPLASSVRNLNLSVRIGSQSFIAIGAATRVVDGIKSSLEGEAHLGTAVDMSFAIVEGTVYAFSRVRLRIKAPSKTYNGDLSEFISDISQPNAAGQIQVTDAQSAKTLSTFFGGQRSPADIQANGLTQDELIQLVSANPGSLRTRVAAHHRSNAQLPQAGDAGSSIVANPCKSLSLAALGLCGVRDPFQVVEVNEARAVFESLNGQQLIHYTNQQGIASIAKYAKIQPGQKGVVYVTPEAFTRSEAHSQLFIASEIYRDKGSFLVIFNRQQGAAYRPTSDVVTPELTHTGTIRLDPSQVVYIGPNLFDHL